VAEDEGKIPEQMIGEEMRTQLRQVFGLLEEPVTLVFFTQPRSCPGCPTQLQLLNEIASLSDKLKLLVYDLLNDRDIALSFKVDKVPATVIIGKKAHGIRFFGVTAGEEFSSLLEAIVMVSTGSTGLKPEMEALVIQLKRPVHLQTYITLTCPFCPKMVQLAHRFAYLNDNLTADMIESAEFPELAQKFLVTKVPRTIINESSAFDGAVPPDILYMEILKAVDPVEYQRLVEYLREMDDGRKAKKVDPLHNYEVIIVGGGPAAMSAAVYAARKGLDIALVADKTGGQITYTSTVDNYLGLPNMSGVEIAEGFRGHLDSYVIAESIGVKASRISKEGDRFTISLVDGRQFKSYAVIYCAGMEYKRLGIPGEERFIGKGIGFCATCDAPLYKGKKVAVVGGGNSAFTAARDLLNYASEIHIVHRRSDFTADRSLQEEVGSSRPVFLHKGMVVGAFLGDEVLRGIRIQGAGTEPPQDLAVEGVFLEIGLAPNSAPLEGLIAMNQWGEVPVSKEQATAVPGLFAAGDVTDVSEKQVSIAVGQGAMAAIYAHKYLAKNGLTKSRVETKEPWQ